MPVVLVLLLSLCSLTAMADMQVLLSANQQEWDLSQRHETRITDKRLPVSHVQKLPVWYQGSEPLIMADKQVTWKRVTLTQQQNQSGRYKLILQAPLVESIHFYLVDELGRVVGSQLATGQHNHWRLAPRQFSFSFSLGAQQSRTLYLRLQDNHSPLVSLQLVEAGRRHWQEVASPLIYAAFMGALAFMSLYLLLSYTTLNSPGRFWLAMLCWLLMAGCATSSGWLGSITNSLFYAEQLLVLLLATAIVCISKLLTHLFAAGSSLLRRLGFALAALIAFTVLLRDPQQQLILLSALVAAVLLLQAAMAVLYRPARQPRILLLFMGGLALLALPAFLWVYFSLAGHWPDTADQAMYLGTLLFAVMLLSWAVAENELNSLNGNATQERSLRELRHSLALCTQGLYISSLNGRFLWVNPAMSQLFGYTEAELLAQDGDCTSCYAHAEDRDRLLGLLSKDAQVDEREIKGRRKDGSEFWMSLSAKVVEQDSRRVIYGAITDISDRRQAQLEKQQRHDTDPLTGLSNRHSFIQALSTALRGTPERVGVVVLDLDGCEQVNERFGHKAGDILLRQLAAMLDALVSPPAKLARIAGDEFAVLIDDANAPQRCQQLSQALVTLVEDFRFIWQQQQFALTAHTGMAWVDQGKIINADGLLNLAEADCSARFAHASGDNKAAIASAEWEPLLTRALDEQGLVLQYQLESRLSDLSQGHHYALSLALPQGGWPRPSSEETTPAAQRLMAMADRYLVSHYFQWLGDNPVHLERLARVRIPLTDATLQDADFPLFVLAGLEKLGIAGNKICLSVCAEALRTPATLDWLAPLQHKGCLLATSAIGDHLKWLLVQPPVAVQLIILENELCHELLSCAPKRALIQGIIALSRANHIPTLAEGVDNRELLTELGKLGVDYATGDIIGLAAPLDSFSAPEQTKSPPAT